MKVFTNMHIGFEIEKPMGLDTIYEILEEVKELSDSLNLSENCSDISEY